MFEAMEAIGGIKRRSELEKEGIMIKDNLKAPINREKQTERGDQESSDEESTRRRKMPGGGTRNERQYTPTGSKRILSESKRVRFRERDIGSETEEEETEGPETNSWDEVTKTIDGEVSGRRQENEKLSTTDLSTTQQGSQMKKKTRSREKKRANKKRIQKRTGTGERHRLPN